MRESLVETLIGAAVALVAAGFLWFALSTTGAASGSGDRYDVTARFNNVSGIARGTDVRLAGMKVGVVKAIDADYNTYEAVLTLGIDTGVPLPDDTDARVVTDGLLGDSYLALEPGGSVETIATDGTGVILYTRGSVDLITLLGSLAGGGGNESNSGEGYRE